MQGDPRVGEADAREQDPPHDPGPALHGARALRRGPRDRGVELPAPPDAGARGGRDRGGQLRGDEAERDLPAHGQGHRGPRAQIRRPGVLQGTWYVGSLRTNIGVFFRALLRRMS